LGVKSLHEQGELVRKFGGYSCIYCALAIHNPKHMNQKNDLQRVKRLNYPVLQLFQIRIQPARLNSERKTGTSYQRSLFLSIKTRPASSNLKPEPPKREFQRVRGFLESGNSTKSIMKCCQNMLHYFPSNTPIQVRGCVGFSSNRNLHIYFLSVLALKSVIVIPTISLSEIR